MFKKTKSFFKENIKEYFRRHRGRRITTEGFFFVLATFTIGFAAFNTGDNSLYMIMSVMLSLLIFSGLLSAPNLKKLSVQRIFPKHISAKEDVSVQIKITNKKRFYSTYSAMIEDFFKSGECIGTGFIMRIPRHKTSDVSYKMKFYKRGIYKIGRIKISSRFPFGFFERSLAIDLDEEVIVYPEIIDISDIVVKEKSDIGEIESGKRGTGTELYGLREYVYGDNAKHIHWKLSAKMGNLMVREYENEERKKVSIIINNSANKFDDLRKMSDKFEKAVVLAASFAYYFIEKDYQVEMLTASGKIPFDSGIYHLHRILRALAIIEIEIQEESKSKILLFSNIDNSSQKILINSDSTVKM